MSFHLAACRKEKVNFVWRAVIAPEKDVWLVGLKRSARRRAELSSFLGNDAASIRAVIELLTEDEKERQTLRTALAVPDDDDE
ncbi:MAG: hypothetical protein PHT12_05535 [Patescibacteria group bacterium]|nr:hypothetical protein [Patescibacteria group bacterium]